jgi:hypothetical protein
LDEQKSNAALPRDLPHPATGNAIGSHKSPMQERHNASCYDQGHWLEQKSNAKKYAEENYWMNKSLQVFIDL